MKATPDKDPGPLAWPRYPLSRGDMLQMSSEQVQNVVEYEGRTVLPLEETELMGAIARFFEAVSYPDFTPIDKLAQYLPPWIHYPPRRHRRAWVRIVEALQRERLAQAYLKNYLTIVVCSTYVDMANKHDREGIELSSDELAAYCTMDYEEWRQMVRSRNYRDRHTLLW